MKFRGLTMMDMFIFGFQIVRKIIKLNKYYGGIMKLWIALHTKYTKLNVQWIKMISQISYFVRFRIILNQREKTAHLWWGRRAPPGRICTRGCTRPCSLSCPSAPLHQGPSSSCSQNPQLPGRRLLPIPANVQVIQRVFILSFNFVWLT